MRPPARLNNRFIGNKVANIDQGQFFPCLDFNPLDENHDHRDKVCAIRSSIGNRPRLFFLRCLFSLAFHYQLSVHVPTSYNKNDSEYDEEQPREKDLRFSLIGSNCKRLKSYPKSFNSNAMCTFQLEGRMYDPPMAIAVYPYAGF
ncbi:MAG: hypothetical protein J3R72DRAFT_423845 [Linnemannia gamsii]|nr:MAG: hypothetical protein J3R72DRAFT_423845 [Linnemannia gamsii]